MYNNFVYNASLYNGVLSPPSVIKVTVQDTLYGVDEMLLAATLGLEDGGVGLEEVPIFQEVSVQDYGPANETLFTLRLVPVSLVDENILSDVIKISFVEREVREFSSRITKEIHLCSFVDKNRVI